ncbi:amino acid/polyamine transporter I [Pseudomassariella vexata]|uniref:Amino acid/polyamine transporter I n=1 Tax=Pseudomassariella vexata TaxID=1141098 RepID=A0A1Y2EBK4_9PEZI|nr:amino acid/polyamine transporter I [Pseudomassariella vexata]ORY68646.1 amino acid/polyamine transporter I [Pseudomassariella vexata]
MAHDDKYQLNAANVLEEEPSSQSPQNGSVDETLVYAQTRTRRLFNEKQLFAFSLVYMGSWNAVGGNMYYGMYNGGPLAWLISYIIIFAGVTCQSASFGELASIQPVAGAQYYWTHHFAPASSKRLLTWLQGWVTWTAYVSMMASGNNYNIAIIEGLISLNNPDYVVVGWRTTLISLSLLIFSTLLNIYAFRIVPWFELLACVFNICLFLIVVVVFYAMAPRNSAEMFTMTNVSSGWDNYFVASHIGSLSNIWLFIGFENVIHMGEETKKAKKIVPRALFWSIFTNGALGFVMIITLLICMPPVDTLLNSASPIVAILLHVTGSVKVSTAITAGLIVLNQSATIGVVSSVSRLTWAWARDGGLPQYFSYVDARHHIPLRAVVLTSTLVGMLTLLNLGSATYIALGAITSLSSMAMYLSYGMILAVVVYARLTRGIELGQWHWGKWGIYLNIAALVYTVYALIWFPFPQTVPVNAENMNYSGPVLGVVFIGAISLWFMRARIHWDGPNRGVADEVLQHGD